MGGKEGQTPSSPRQVNAPSMQNLTKEAVVPPSPRASSKVKKRGRQRTHRYTSNVFSMFNQEQIQEFKEAFNMIDQNRDGFIDKEDLIEMLTSLGKDPTDQFVDEMVAEAPGPLNFTMFLTLFGERLNGTDPEDVIKNAFACFDHKNVGYLHEDYFREVMTTMGDRWSDDLVDDLFHGAPIHAGHFDYMEFIRTLKHGAKDKDEASADVPPPSPRTPGPPSPRGPVGPSPLSHEGPKQVYTFNHAPLQTKASMSCNEAVKPQARQYDGKTAKPDSASESKTSKPASKSDGPPPSKSAFMESKAYVSKDGPPRAAGLLEQQTQSHHTATSTESKFSLPRSGQLSGMTNMSFTQQSQSNYTSSSTESKVTALRAGPTPVKSTMPLDQLPQTSQSTIPSHITTTTTITCDTTTPSIKHVPHANTNSAQLHQQPISKMFNMVTKPNAALDRDRSISQQMCQPTLDPPLASGPPGAPQPNISAGVSLPPQTKVKTNIVLSQSNMPVTKTTTITMSSCAQSEGPQLSKVPVSSNFQPTKSNLKLPRTKPVSEETTANQEVIDTNVIQDSQPQKPIVQPKPKAQTRPANLPTKPNATPPSPSLVQPQLNSSPSKSPQLTPNSEYSPASRAFSPHSPSQLTPNSEYSPSNYRALSPLNPPLVESKLAALQAPPGQYKLEQPLVEAKLNAFRRVSEPLPPPHHPQTTPEPVSPARGSQQQPQPRLAGRPKFSRTTSDMSQPQVGAKKPGEGTSTAMTGVANNMTGPAGAAVSLPGQAVSPPGQALSAPAQAVSPPDQLEPPPGGKKKPVCVVKSGPR